MKHKSEDYKISAVQYYIKNKLITDKIRKNYKIKKERDDKIRELNNKLRRIKNDLLNIER